MISIAVLRRLTCVVKAVRHRIQKKKIPITTCCVISIFFFFSRFSQAVRSIVLHLQYLFSETERNRMDESEWECEMKSKWLKSPMANTFYFSFPRCGFRTIDGCAALCHHHHHHQSYTHIHTSLFASIHARQQHHTAVVVFAGIGRFLRWLAIQFFCLYFFFMLLCS